MSAITNARSTLMEAWEAASDETRRSYLRRRGLPTGTTEEMEVEFRAHVARMLDGLE